MAATITCDGCGATQQEGQEFHRRGHVCPVDYCDRCNSVYDNFVQRRDDIHTRLANQWKAKIQELENIWLEDYPDMRLPDR